MAQHLAFMQAACGAGEDGALRLAHDAATFSHMSVLDRARAQISIVESLSPGLRGRIDGLDDFVASREAAAASCCEWDAGKPRDADSLLLASESFAGGGISPSAADLLVSAGHRLIEQQRHVVSHGRDAPLGRDRALGRAVESVVEALIMIDVSSGHLARQWGAVARAVALGAQGRPASGASASLRERLEAGTVVGWYSLEALARVAVEDASAFCAEKHGGAPVVRVRVGDGSGRTVGVAADAGPMRSLLKAPAAGAAAAVVALAHTEYALVEVLKNAMGAHVRRFGALDVDDDDLPPITVDVGATRALAGWRVTDAGGGCADPAAALDMFSSAAAKRLPAGVGGSAGGPGGAAEGEDWRYSRAFGAAFSGYGMGLCRSSWYMRVMGGTGVSLTSLPGVGCIASAMFPRSGGVEDLAAITAAAARADAAAAAFEAVSPG